MAGRSFLSAGGVRLSQTSQSIACTTTSTTVTNAFGSQTFAIRLAVSGTGLTHYRIGDTTALPTAVTSDPYLPNTWVEYVIVTPGQKIAAITESSTATLTITEITQ